MKKYFLITLFLLDSCGVKLADNIVKTTPSPSTSVLTIPVQLETLGQIDFRRVLSGERSNVISYETRIIDNELDFIKLWDDHTGSKTNPLFVPKVDFTLKNVVAIFMGERPTTGFSTQITGINETKDSIKISVKEYKPIAGQQVKAEITQPFLFIETKKSRKRFIIENTSLNISKSEDIKFTNIESGYDSGIKDFSKRLAKNEKEFSELYREHLSSQKTVNAIVFPKIDFEKEMVAAIFLGERPSSGYDINIKNVSSTDSQIVIEANETIPKKDLVTSNIITYPYQFITIPKSDLSVKFDISLTVPQSGIINGTSTNTDNKIETLIVKPFMIGENSNIKNQQYLVIKSRDEFKNIWFEHTASNSSTIPEIDFGNNSLIAVFSGNRNGAGFSINVSSAVETKNDLRVFVDLSRDLSQAKNIVTSPFSMVLIPKTFKNPTFIINNRSTN